MGGDANGAVAASFIIRRRAVDASVLAALLGLPGGYGLNSMNQHIESLDRQVAVLVAKRDATVEATKERLQAIERRLDRMERVMARDHSN